MKNYNSKFKIFILHTSYLILFLSLVFPVAVFALTEVKNTYPRLANYFLHWTISDKEARELAKWDLLILDPETKFRSSGSLQTIRQLNPGIVILAYVPAAEIRADWPYFKEIAPARYKLGSQIQEGWYLKDSSGNRRSFWPGTWILNVADKAPLVGGKRWNDFLPQFVAEEILKDSFWNGVFYDNGWENITYFAKGTPDLDGDGRNDDSGEADRLWREGLKTIFQKTHRLAPDKIIMENDGVIYASDVDGVMLENFFKDSDWTRFARNMQKIQTQSRMNLPILNGNTKNIGTKNDWQAMRYGLATALIFNGFYSFDFGDQSHGQLWWYDEYDSYLGEPIDAPRRIDGGTALRRDLWRRDFQNGVVFLNSADKVANLKFNNEEFEKLRGNQDKSVNDGSIISEFSLLPSDGLIVRRPLYVIQDSVFINGSFYRIFNEDGVSVRAGFFAFDEKYASRAKLAFVDLDGDGRKETISANGPLLRITDDRKSVDIFPYGQKWQGGLNFAFGDVDGNGVKEIVVAPEQGGGAEIRVYRLTGELISLPWRAFGDRFAGGASVAIGDLNNDGFAEIIVGAGRGGGPQVRIFTFEGRLLSGGFFAYDPRFRGGVRVASGDIDGDGQAEIITGPGRGGGPHVRVFDSKGQPIGSGFFAFDKEGKAGVMPSVTDIDGDGKMEILGTTVEAF